MVLFVYGTLRRSAGHPMHASLRAVASFGGPARVRGRLYLIDGYPGVVLDQSAGWVLGELYHVADPESLARIDAYEGISANDPLPHEYRRVLRPVDPIDPLGAEPCSAWIYEYAWPIEGRPLIPSGDFVEHGR